MTPEQIREALSRYWPHHGTNDIASDARTIYRAALDRAADLEWRRDWEWQRSDEFRDELVAMAYQWGLSTINAGVVADRIIALLRRDG